MPNFDLGRLLDKIMREIFDNQKLQGKTREKLWQKYYDFFASAVDVGYSPDFEYYSKELAVNLLANIGQFSAFKARSFEKSLAESLINSKGRVSWDDFKKTANVINSDYNKKWLKTEYHQTVTNTHMAGKWQDFQRTKDIFPNLRYETVGDQRVRPEHAGWDGIVLPIDHPWWHEHYPPNDWGCRCDVIRTDEPVSKHIPSGQLKIEFKNNPAISGKVFNQIAYEKGLSKVEYKEALLISNKSEIKELNRYAEVPFKQVKINGGGVLEVFLKFKQTKQEFQKNKIALTHLVKATKGRVRMLPILKDGETNPDAFDLILKKFIEVKVPNGTNSVNIVQGAISEANRQGAPIVLIHLTKEPNTYIGLFKGLKLYIDNKRIKNIEIIHLINTKDELKTYYIKDIKERFKNYKVSNK